MGRKRKNFRSLSKRSQRRRIQEAIKNSINNITLHEHALVQYHLASTSTSSLQDNHTTSLQTKVGSVCIPEALILEDSEISLEDYEIHSENSVISSESSVENFTHDISDYVDHQSILSDDAFVEAVPPASDQSLSNVYEACEMCSEKLKEILKKWMESEKSVSHVSFSRLLKGLQPHFRTLPCSSKTLLPLMKDYILSPMAHGEYAHFNNWKQGLINTINAIPQLEHNKINLLMNIDGIPLFPNTVKYTAYPLLLKIMKIPFKILVVGIYCSNKTKKTECHHLKSFYMTFFLI